MEQCLHCACRLFFKPLSDETYTCCQAWGESVKDIDLKTGVSPAILKHGLNEVPCCRFSAGISVCQTSETKPFLIHPIRKEGEKYLCKIMGIAQSI